MTSSSTVNASLVEENLMNILFPPIESINYGFSISVSETYLSVGDPSSSN
jgi:hypothetical protein